MTTDAVHQCIYLGRCGGCSATSTFEDRCHQLNQLLSSYCDTPVATTTHPCPPERRRIMLRMHCNASGTTVGYFEAGSRSITSITRCAKAHAKANDVIAALNQFVSASEEEGRIRVHIDIVMQSGMEVIYLRLIAAPAPESLIEALSRFLIERLPEVKILSASSSELVFCEDDQLYVNLSPHGFRQVNKWANAELRETVASWIKSKAPRSIVDLCAGNGNLSIPVDRTAKTLRCVESEPGNIAALSANLRHYGIIASASVPMRIEDYLSGDRASASEFVILDPPRRGAGDLVLSQMHAKIRPAYVAYVSCHEDGLRSDLECFKKLRYKVEQVAYIDMFSHTEHVEVAVLFRMDS